jgi:hypothetical protein
MFSYSIPTATVGFYALPLLSNFEASWQQSIRQGSHRGDFTLGNPFASSDALMEWTVSQRVVVV